MVEKSKDEKVNFTVEQIQLQSLLDSGFVPAWRQEFAKGIANNTRPSPKQLIWVKKIIDEILVKKPIQPNAVSFKPIFDLFVTAKSHGLKYPKIVLQFQNKELKLSLASGAARHPNSITLVLGQAYIGRIGTDHKVVLFKADIQNGELITFLEEFNKDPARIASEHGKLKSSCCFCRLPLSTPESLAVGYGDTCAKHWGLPWGKDKITKNEILELPF